MAAVSILGNFIFDRPTPTDFMEAMLNCRSTDPLLTSQVGDVILLPGDRGAHVLLLKGGDIPGKLAASLKAVRSVSVEVSELPLSEVHRRPANVKEMTVVEASARLDAVGNPLISTFGLSSRPQPPEPSASVGRGW